MYCRVLYEAGGTLAVTEFHNLMYDVLDERERCSVEDSTSKMTACLSEDEGPEAENAI